MRLLVEQDHAIEGNPYMLRFEFPVKPGLDCCIGIPLSIDEPVDHLSLFQEIASMLPELARAVSRSRRRG